MRKSQVKSLQRKKLKSIHQITIDPEGGPQKPVPLGVGPRAGHCKQSDKAYGCKWRPQTFDLPRPGCSQPCLEGGTLI